jgi:hypothetical protein
LLFFLLVVSFLKAEPGLPAQARSDQPRPKDEEAAIAARLQGALREVPFFSDVAVSIYRGRSCGPYRVIGTNYGYIGDMCHEVIIMVMESEVLPFRESALPLQYMGRPIVGERIVIPQHAVSWQTELNDLFSRSELPTDRPFNVTRLLAKTLDEIEIPPLTLGELSQSSTCPEVRIAATLLGLAASMATISSLPQVANSTSAQNRSGPSYALALQKTLDANRLGVKVRADGSQLVVMFQDTQTVEEAEIVRDTHSNIERGLCPAGFVTFLPKTEAASTRNTRKSTNPPVLTSYMLNCDK